MLTHPALRECLPPGLHQLAAQHAPIFSVSVGDEPFLITCLSADCIIIDNPAFGLMYI